MTKTQCIGRDCETAVYCRSMCKKHYARWKKGKDINEPSIHDLSPEQRFWRNVEKTETCWNWTGARCHRVWYGRLFINGLSYGTHRFSWELHNGDVWAIRDLAELGMTQSMLAEFFDIATGTVNAIIHRKTWTHI